jgi:hypothetical protein
LILLKVLKHPTKSEPKLMRFAPMTPHLLWLDHSMSSICDQKWVMLCCKTSSCRPISAKPSHELFWLDHVQNFLRMIKPNLSSN